MRCLILIALTACSTEPKRVDTATTPDPCSPAALKLPSAKPLATFTVPEGCTPRTDDQLVTSADAFECKGAPLGVDFTKQALVVVQRTLSPATIGVLALDDGKTVTLVNKARNPCPKDPQPMPVPATFVFVIDGTERAFAEASCTIQPKC